ncbi:MAG: TonB-dependent receptor plug domain-containing protein [Bacteroidales bacterium]|nr:TonB-dependent receptor plug domain-containing protein [Candidatus Physcousia equi]
MVQARTRRYLTNNARRGALLLLCLLPRHMVGQQTDTLCDTAAQADTRFGTAAQQTAQTDTLREVAVDAARRMKDTGIEQTVLDTTLLHQNVAYSMADILQAHTALFVKSYGRATESTAEFRGTSPSHTQVTWNGMKINSPMLGSVDFSYIPSHFIDEAKLLHGASSVSHTGGGLGGAIVLNTEPQWAPGWQFEFTQGVGSYRTFDEFLKLNYANQHWSTNTRISFGHSLNNFRFVNYDKKVDLRDEQGKLISSYHPTETNRSGYFDDLNVMQQVAWRDLHGNELGATAWYGYSLRGLPFLSVDYKDNSHFTNEHKQQTLRSVLFWNHTNASSVLCVRAGYLYQDVDYNYFTQREAVVNTITHSRSYTQTGFLQGLLDYFLSPRWQLGAQAAVYYNHVRSWDRSPFHTGNNYQRGRAEEHLSASARWRPLDALTFHAVLRAEAYAADGVPLIPAFYADWVIYRPWNLVLKASLARNYRYPSMDDLYFQPGGNAALLPEQGFTYDGGLELNIKRRRWSVKGNITAFDSYIDNWIQWTPNTKGYWTPANVKRVHNYGMEWAAEINYTPSPQLHTTLRGNLAYTPSLNKGERVNDNDNSYDKQLCYVPRISANAQLAVQWRSWRLNYQWVHYGRRYTTTSNEVDRITGELLPYFMNNVSIEKGFRLRHLQLSLKAVVNNLLNEHYMTVLSRPMPGRNFEIFLNLKLGK